MIYKIKFTSKFIKDLKLAKKQNRDIEKLMDVIEKLVMMKNWMKNIRTIH